VVEEEDDVSDWIGDSRLLIGAAVAVSPSGALLPSRLLSPAAAAAAAAAALITLGIAAEAAGGRRSVSWMLDGRGERGRCCRCGADECGR
jgi:hypothetical protein